MNDAGSWGRMGGAELARRIADGEVKSREVVEIRIARLREAHQRLNVLSVDRFEAALKEADAADQCLARQEIVGPLHGVPMTVKDCFDIAGLPTALGVDGQDRPVTQDSYPVARLRAAGAIILGKTTVPQLMMLLETSSPRHGETLHPTHADRTPGGSSGGEAAAIASGGSPLGLGTDMGGSIRIPAHFCGVFGLKPGSHLWEMAGVRQLFPHTGALPTVVGPLAQNAEDLALAYHLIRDEGHSPATSWMGAHGAGNRWRCAVWENDPYIGASPAIVDAVRRAAAKLESLGVELVSIPPPDIRQAVALFVALASADGGVTARGILRNSRMHPQIRQIISLAGMPAAIRAILMRWSGWRAEAYQADLYRYAARRTVRGYWQLLAEVLAYRQRFLESLKAERIDFCLTPPFIVPAFRRGASLDLTVGGGFAFLANLLDLPAGVVPLGHVSPEMETVRPEGGSTTARIARKSEIGSSGLPVGVQLIAGPSQEGLLLKLMRLLEPPPRHRWDADRWEGAAKDPRKFRGEPGSSPVVPPFQPAG